MSTLCGSATDVVTMTTMTIGQHVRALLSVYYFVFTNKIETVKYPQLVIVQIVANGCSKNFAHLKSQKKKNEKGTLNDAPQSLKSIKLFRVL